MKRKRQKPAPADKFFNNPGEVKNVSEINRCRLAAGGGFFGFAPKRDVFVLSLFGWFVYFVVNIELLK